MMQSPSLISEDRLASLVSSIAHSAVLPSDRVVPFADEADFLAELFTLTDPGCPTILSAGYAPPMAALAADRAGLRMRDMCGISPFAGDPDTVVNAVDSGRETIYVANPNRVTGAHLSIRDLSIIADAVPNGLVIVDEYYFDYYGSSGYRLLETYPNIILTRSLTAGFGVPATAAGYAVAHPAIQDRLYQHLSQQSFSAVLHRTVTAALENSDVKALRIKMLHDESLRVSSTLTQLGAQCRITPTDFMLIRVGDPAAVAEQLNLAGVSIDTLERFDGLGEYLRYQLQSGQANESLLTAFSRLPKGAVSVRSSEKRTLKLRKAAEKTKARTGGVPTKTIRRNRTPQVTVG